MATVHLHPTACNREAVIGIQRRTGLIATNTGELITHAEHQRRINRYNGFLDRILSRRVRDSVKNHLRRQAEDRCRYPDPETDPGPGPSAA